MPPDSNIPSYNDNPKPGNVPPLLPASEPPVISAPPPLVTGAPPALPPPSPGKSSPVRRLLAILLSLCLGLFLADAVVSLLDDSLLLFFDIHILTTLRTILFLFAIFMAILTYGLMAVTPMIPKRLFLPVTLFNPVAGLLIIPFLIYFYSRVQQIAWVVSCSQLIFGLGILYWFRGGLSFRGPLVSENQLEPRGFSWLNLSVFLLVNIFVLLPLIGVYLFFCASLAVDHFSEGFLALRPGGFTVQVRKYVRNDGKTIQLVPMSHVAEPDFYRKLSQSFPTNSILLVEGVTDNRNLLTNKISYKRMATSLGLAEQQKEFKPSRVKSVRADVDVGQFSPDTIDFLNLVMLLHAKGLNPETLQKLMQYSQPPHFEDQLFDDLLTKRNQRLLEELHTRLSQSDHMIVPWGAAHMPGIAREIQKSGFRLDEARDYQAIRFHFVGNKSKTGGKAAP